MSTEEKNIEQVNDENVDESPTETENPIEVCLQHKIFSQIPFTATDEIGLITIIVLHIICWFRNLFRPTNVQFD